MANRRPCKRALVEFLDGHDDDDAEKVYRFQILLPNGTSTRIALHDPAEDMLIDEFIYHIRKEVEYSAKAAHGERQRILWNEDIYLEDMHDNKIKKKICFRHFKTNKCHILRLHDGAGRSVNTFQNMWDLTPDTDLLAELPAEYTFETALADLIDNSLQAVWSNGSGERRLLSVMINEQKIVIFDSGPGMDGSEENSISKWGRMGSSNHRPSRQMAIGGKAPYLMPFFGMFGYGGPIASMHLGRHAVVSSKTKESKKVYTLHLSRDALLNKSTRKCVWRTDGGIRDPLEEEIQISPHGSFTQVEIQDLKMRFSETFKLQCFLKDVYFPYIQCDEEHASKKTSMPVEFQVNDIDLAEVQGGEVAVTNLHSCHGPDFVLRLHFVLNQENITSKSPGSVVCREANARLKCVYFPIVEGKESIERILEKLEEDGYGIKENFENFCRVSIRRLGRLLPDARWQPLPLMEAKQRRGDKAQLLKRCCRRVKCFVETDAGFSPTPSKTDLAHHDPLTLALRNFGYKSSGKESEVIIEMQKDGKPLNLSQLEKEYQDWIIQMHDRYDEELDGGEDEPVLVINPSNKKKLGITADVVRVHQAIRRKGLSWKSGQKVKILKGAIGCTKNNLYATLEYVLVEGFQGDVGGEARLICRPLGFSEELGCSLVFADGNASLDVHNSLSFPISVIDSGKFQAIDLTSWNCQLAKKEEKVPSAIDVLTGNECCLLQIDGELPIEAPVIAGYVPPAEIVAVIRPASFIHSSSPNSLDQKYILKDELEMSMEVSHMHENKGSHNVEFVYAERVKPSSRNGVHGLYIYSLRQRYPELFCKAGVYIFLFSVVCKDSSCKRKEVKVTVKPDLRVQKWRVMQDDHSPLAVNSSLVIRVGSYISYLSIACFDLYSNQIPFSSLPEAVVKIYANKLELVHVDKMKMALSSNQLLLEITDMLIECHNLDMIRPSNEAMLEVSSQVGVLSALVACKVMPGPLSSVKMQSTPGLEKNLAPGKVIDKLVLEMFDAYGNHIEAGVEVSIHLDGLCFQDHMGSIRKVNSDGCVTLCGLLKVVAGYGSKVCLSVFVDDKLVVENILQVAKRELRAVSGVPGYCTAGSHLENVVFEIFDSDGVVDEAIHGQHHTLTIKSEPLKLDGTIQYTFQHGRCIVPVIPVPQESGTFRIMAFHTHFPDLRISIEICVGLAPKLELVTVTDLGASIYQSQFSDDRIPLLLESSQCHSSQMIPSPTSLYVTSIIDDAKKLDDAMAELGLRIREHEGKIKMLDDQKTQIGKEIYDLKVLMGPQHLSQINLLINAKEKITKQIEGKSDTAAAVFCNLRKAIQILEPQEHFMEDVVGLASLLGTVSDSKLSRIFAEYLGENYMLAIVCKSYEAATALERYGADGKINRHSALHEAAATLGITINRRFPVICLEEISPYKGEIINNDPQRWLALPDPLLQSGETPAGFKGYAVNMINLDIDHLNTRTAAGYGLRETLFYRLFGKLQVYQTREHMKVAKTCIKHGAISLDGGIMRENGIILLGDCEPEIVFPVITFENQMELSRNMIDVLKQMEEKRCLLKVIDEEMSKVAEARVNDLARFRKKSKQLRAVLARKNSLENSFPS
ncbi:structural maintenance of chromosomes flexible hinge domain-containing protein GMI1 isoform X2 [Phoenix dactylifera]|uniref:Structural maintenance of chromosomes flexible hinge domain-containing protein GMI1 isoform X2 n=1 Tax=Phoenix dactylifera TaxID=42345 RepID=A0A8B8J1I8_PHODC|nr:structural maintenance of chromosomes flexible hinge domain-containing protein GMI1 isoform X2 [Phoenix dactylifera]